MLVIKFSSKIFKLNLSVKLKIFLKQALKTETKSIADTLYSDVCNNIILH